MPIRFTKVESIGNDFVLIDATNAREMDWSSLAIKMCAHGFGVGSDGLLVLSGSEAADFRFRMFNPDGSEDVCGNGMRCASVYLHERGMRSGPNVALQARYGIVHAEVLAGLDGRPEARVDMGVPSTRPEDIPVAGGIRDTLDIPIEIDGEAFRLNCVLVGTPHTVIFAEQSFFWETIPTVSALLERHPLFPERINVTWCHVEAPDSLIVRTWERGVGPTLGCGSGACAALVAANLSGLAGTAASVRSPGGVLQVDWPDRMDISACGPARIVFEGEWPHDQLMTED